MLMMLCALPSTACAAMEFTSFVAKPIVPTSPCTTLQDAPAVAQARPRLTFRLTSTTADNRTARAGLRVRPGAR